MTNNRKIKLYNEMLNYIYDVVNDNAEFFAVLKNLGFTPEEIAEIKLDVEY